MTAAVKRVSIFLDHLLHRDKYLEELNGRIHHFKDIFAASSARAIDGAADRAAGDAAPVHFAVPETPAATLTVEFAREAMRDHGCFIARGLFASAEVGEIRAYIDHTFAVNSGEAPFSRYLSKQVDLGEVLQKMRDDIAARQQTNNTYMDTVKLGRKLTRALGANVSCLVATSPILSRKLLGLFEHKGLKALLARYFGHEPCVSVYKWVARRAVSPPQPIDFHQDGAFMGDDISSLNCWLALSDCGAGTNAPGIDIVPARVMTQFAKGTGVMNWTISEQAVVDTWGREAIVTPTFRAGDAFFFDHGLVHRTQHMPGTHATRYAMETWFFDATNFPKNQIPIRW